MQDKDYDHDYGDAPRGAPEEIRTLIDRIAAAFMRNDFAGAREIADDERLKWEAEGRQQERENQERQRRREFEINREADVWFYTKDGLVVKMKIGTEGRGYFPHEWQRSCVNACDNAVRLTDKPFSMKETREIRTYRREGVAKDGRPIYREI